MHGNVHVSDLFDPNYLLKPLLLAGSNKDESDQKLAANIYKCAHPIPETKIRLRLLYDSNKTI